MDEIYSNISLHKHKINTIYHIFTVYSGKYSFFINLVEKQHHQELLIMLQCHQSFTTLLCPYFCMLPVVKSLLKLGTTLIFLHYFEFKMR